MIKTTVTCDVCGKRRIFFGDYPLLDGEEFNFNLRVIISTSSREEEWKSYRHVCLECETALREAIRGIIKTIEANRSAYWKQKRIDRIVTKILNEPW